VDALAGMKVPTFFIVGAPKAGTTSLYAHLDQHPQVYLSPLAALLSRDLTAWL
jgi:hypothetical protein